MLDVKNLSCGYLESEVLHDVGLTVRANSMTALIGANGAGKTTLLNCMSGIVKARTGSIVCAGVELVSRTPHDIVAQGLIHCPEGRRLFGRMSVEENLTLGGFVQRNAKQTARRIDEVYDIFPALKTRRRQLCGTLSGGEQQMVALGRALVAQPKILMLDEPSLGLAPLVVAQIFEVLHSLCTRGMTLFIVEQNAALALRYSSHAYVLERGRIILQGPAQILAEDARVQAAYLGGEV